MANYSCKNFLFNKYCGSLCLLHWLCLACYSTVLVVVFTTLFWYLFVLTLELMDLSDCTCVLRAVFSTYSLTVRSYCIVICMF